MLVYSTSEIFIGGRIGFLAVRQPILAGITFKWFRIFFCTDKTFTLLPKAYYTIARFLCLFLQLIGYAHLCYASERSEVDPVNRQMILRTHNVSTLLFVRKWAEKPLYSLVMHERDASCNLWCILFFSIAECCSGWTSEINIADKLCLICSFIRKGFSAYINNVKIVFDILC